MFMINKAYVCINTILNDAINEKIAQITFTTVLYHLFYDKDNYIF